MAKLLKKIVEKNTAALGMKNMGDSTEGQPDGFKGVGEAGTMSLKAKNLNGLQEVFGTDGKPSGFRGKSLPGEPANNLDKAASGNNVGGGKM